MRTFLKGSFVKHIVYRGEHGISNRDIQTRCGSISFGDIATANHYAIHPNYCSDTAHAPRVIPAYLSICAPVINNKNDPFIDISKIIETLGREKATTIALKFSSHIENTNNWEENFSQFGSVRNMLIHAPELLTKLYFDAYLLLNSRKIVGWFKAAGFDGAIHAGNGETHGTIEYKVFSCDQIRSAIGSCGLSAERTLKPPSLAAANEFH